MKRLLFVIAVIACSPCIDAQQNSIATTIRARRVIDGRGGVTSNATVTIRHGKILSSNLHDGSMSADIRATIQPDEPLPSTLAGQPVEVSVDRGPSLDWLIDRALATGF